MMRIVTFALLLFSSGALAGFLRISSESDLRLIEKKGEIFLQGKFTLQNQGDESAKDVFPEFTMDRWALALSKQSLDPMQKWTWDVDEQIPRSLLCIKASADCLLALPDQGDFPLRVDKNYQDQNGYAFSAPDILRLSFDRKASSDKKFELIKLELKVIAESESQYRADYVIRNQVDRPIKLALHHLVPKEVETTTADLPVEIFALGELRGSFIFRNKTGLIGSEYLSFLVAEMTENHRRKFVWSSASFKIQKFIEPARSGWRWPISRDGVWALFWGFLSMLAFVWVYFYWQRKD